MLTLYVGEKKNSRTSLIMIYVNNLVAKPELVI